MTILERTAYPRFPGVLAPGELQACYAPLPDDLEWARRSTRGERSRMGVLVLLKAFQQLHYFGYIACDQRTLDGRHPKRSRKRSAKRARDLYPQASAICGTLQPVVCISIMA